MVYAQLHFIFSWSCWSYVILISSLTSLRTLAISTITSNPTTTTNLHLAIAVSGASYLLLTGHLPDPHLSETSMTLDLRP